MNLELAQMATRARLDLERQVIARLAPRQWLRLRFYAAMLLLDCLILSVSAIASNLIRFANPFATEGFGIVAPLAGERPSWGFLTLLGVIGGAPTFLGTLVGQRLINDLLSIAFLGLAAGSILYVVIDLLTVARKANLRTVTAWGIFAGLILGLATDAILTAAGA